jgi:hypothetical protein
MRLVSTKKNVSPEAAAALCMAISQIGPRHSTSSTTVAAAVPTEPTAASDSPHGDQSAESYASNVLEGAHGPILPQIGVYETIAP